MLTIPNDVLGKGAVSPDGEDDPGRFMLGSEVGNVDSNSNGSWLWRAVARAAESVGVGNRLGSP
jgi:hypothetical protein